MKTPAHVHFQVKTRAGHIVMVKGDPKMSAKTRRALGHMMDMAVRQFGNPAVRGITPEMGARIFHLMEHCSMSASSEKIEIFPQSRRVGGKAIENLAGELSMLLRGFTPRERAKI